jgi:hypothetical protein
MLFAFGERHGTTMRIDAGALESVLSYPQSMDC